MRVTAALIEKIRQPGLFVEYHFSKFLSQCFEDRVIKNISRPIYRFAFYLAGN